MSAGNNDSIDATLRTLERTLLETGEESGASVSMAWRIRKAGKYAKGDGHFYAKGKTWTDLAAFQKHLMEKRNSPHYADAEVIEVKTYSFDAPMTFKAALSRAFRDKEARRREAIRKKEANVREKELALLATLKAKYEGSR